MRSDFVQGSALMGLPPPEEPGVGLGNHRSVMSQHVPTTRGSHRFCYLYIYIYMCLNIYIYIGLTILSVDHI